MAGAEKKNFPGQVGVEVVGLAENKANSAPLELELSLAKNLGIFKWQTKKHKFW